MKNDPAVFAESFSPACGSSLGAFSKVAFGTLALSSFDCYDILRDNNAIVNDSHAGDPQPFSIHRLSGNKRLNGAINIPLFVSEFVSISIAF